MERHLIKETVDGSQGTGGLAWDGQGRQRSFNRRFRRSVLHAVFFQDTLREREGHKPEELIAAAHAGCFTMALAFQLQGAGYDPTELSTEAAVSLEKEGQGFRISKSALTLRAQVAGIQRGKFEELARAAEKNCPVSKLLNAEITMDWQLS